MFTPCDMRLKPDGGDPRLRFFDKRSDKSINESAAAVPHRLNQYSNKHLGLLQKHLNKILQHTFHIPYELEDKMF